MAHICHIQTTFNRRSGSGRRTATILQAAVEEGYRASLLVGRDHDLGEVDLPGVTVEVIGKLAKPVRPGRDAAALGRLTGRLRRLKPDLVHTHLAKAGILGREAATRAAVARIVHTVHGPTFPDHLPLLRRHLFRALERRAARRTDAMVFVGEELRASYLAAGVGERSRSRVIRTARTPGEIAFRPPGEAARRSLRAEVCGGAGCELLLLAVGRLVPAKRPQHAVGVLEELCRRGVDARLALAGEALVDAERSFERRLRRIVAASPWAERIRFLGYRRDVLALMAAADAVLLTSRHEGLPNVAVEAVLAGTPVVGYAVTGLAEVVGASGRVVPESRPPALVEPLLELRADPAAARRRVAERRRAVACEYTRERMIDSTLALYREILA